MSPNKILAATIGTAMLALPIASYATLYYDTLQSTQPGTTAPAGTIGETQSLSVVVGSAITAAATGVGKDLGTVVITPGTWACSASFIVTAAGTTMTAITAAFGTTTATLPTAPAGGYATVSTSATTTGLGGIVTRNYVTSVAATTTLYPVIAIAYTGTAPTYYGGAVCVRLK